MSTLLKKLSLRAFIFDFAFACFVAIIGTLELAAIGAAFETPVSFDGSSILSGVAIFLCFQYHRYKAKSEYSV